jgi:hypothetical protein
MYVDFHNGEAWQTIATFTGTSNNPGPYCILGDLFPLPSPDYWSNNDSNRFMHVNWQDRGIPDVPAFHTFIDSSRWSISSAPRFRWRVITDGSSSDHAHNWGVVLDTDGAGFLDNVTVIGDEETYLMDFESGLDSYWSFPLGEGRTDQWHMTHDTDPPYEGGDGGERTTCTTDSSVAFRARPEGGYPLGEPWRNGWFYMLFTPEIPITNSGTVVQFDMFMCMQDNTCDNYIEWVQFYDEGHETWCPMNQLGIWKGGCFFWKLDHTIDVTQYYGPNAGKMRFGWGLFDWSYPACGSASSHCGAFFCGRHKGTDVLIDNVSVGFFDASATTFAAWPSELLHDTFYTNLCGFNSRFPAYVPDSVNYYAHGAHSLKPDYQLFLDVIDKDGISSVELIGSVNDGAAWTSKPMTLEELAYPEYPDMGGAHYGTLCPADFGLGEWETGTEVWYYVRCTDALDNEEYFPNDANPGSPDHTGISGNYLTYSILPMYPDNFERPKILLVNGYGRTLWEYSPCLTVQEERVPLPPMYESALSEAGYCYDKYDITGGGMRSQIHYLCTWNQDYDAVIWFTGPYFSIRLFDGVAQEEMRNYLASGGKVVICGDRVAYNSAPISEGGVGADSLGGEFCEGILGVDYLGEMDSSFERPFIYAVGAASVDVFGVPTPVDLDTFAIYRECPYLKDMSWVKAVDPPLAGYTAQPLLDALNPDPAEAQMGTYTEYQGVGQCAFINFDLSASINHRYGYCDGSVPEGYQSYTPGYYEGRVDLLLTILEDIFGLPSGGSGAGGTTETPRNPRIKWALHQNSPNPCASGTEVRYDVAVTSNVSIKIYNARGQLVRTLARGHREPGKYTARWDGRNSAGAPVSSGVYFYKMEAGSFRTTKKMLVVN